MRKNNISDLLQLQIAAFWKSVAPIMDDRGCWEWIGDMTGVGPKNRYGEIAVKIGGSRNRIKAHRFSRILHYGNISEEVFVLHKCDNPTCVNPRHLFLGSKRDNTQDMLLKGRGRWAGHTKTCRVDCDACGKKHHDLAVVERCKMGRFRKHKRLDDARLLDTDEQRAWDEEAALL